MNQACQNSICYPYDEGGASFRRLQDICKAFITKQWWKQWWILRATNYLQKEFLMDKYCQRIRQWIKRWGNSHCWNAMCKIRSTMDQYILQKIGRGDCKCGKIIGQDQDSELFDNISLIIENEERRIPLDNISIRMLIKLWQTWKTNNPVLNMLMQCLPVMALSELLKARCGAKYDKDIYNTRKTINNISTPLVLILKRIF